MCSCWRCMGFITLSSCLLPSTTGPMDGDVVIVLQKTSHTSTFEKEKQNFNSIVFMGLRPYGLVKLSSSIVTQVSMWQIASTAC